MPSLLDETLTTFGGDLRQENERFEQELEAVRQVGTNRVSTKRLTLLQKYRTLEQQYKNLKQMAEEVDIEAQKLHEENTTLKQQLTAEKEKNGRVVAKVRLAAWELCDDNLARRRRGTAPASRGANFRARREGGGVGARAATAPRALRALAHPSRGLARSSAHGRSRGPHGQEGLPPVATECDRGFRQSSKRCWKRPLSVCVRRPTRGRSLGVGVRRWRTISSASGTRPLSTKRRRRCVASPLSDLMRSF